MSKLRSRATGDLVMSRILAAAYGTAAYLVFLATFLYAIGFVGNYVVPKSIDAGGVTSSPGTALAVDLLLLAIFAVQHSAMARPAFKRWWTRFVPAVIERSTYVLFASAALILLFWQWRPLTATVWQVDGPAAAAITFVFVLGWLTVLLSTFLISHFELFGLQQVWLNLTNRMAASPTFHTPFLYRWVRHPLYLGFILAFWAAPHMSLGHLLFAGATTLYILIAIQLEERDLVGAFGEAYVAYRTRVSMLIPLPPRSP